MASTADLALDRLRQELEELRASCARLMTAADAERSGIERELHDGTQQHLVALAVNVQHLRRLLDTNTAAAREVLEELGRDVHDALESVRELAHRVYPSLLVDRGLPDALKSAATELRLRARIEEDGIPRFEPAVEAALYFACVDVLRGLTTADDARLTIRMRAEADRIVLELSGVGVQVEEPSLVAARDRVGALGGRLTLSRASLVLAVPVARP